MKNHRQDKKDKVRLVRDQLYINGFEYIPPEKDENTDRNAKNKNESHNLLSRSYDGYKRYTKTRVFQSSSKTKRPEKSFSHPTGKTYASKVLDFTLQTENKYTALQHSGNSNASWRYRADSRKNKSSSPLDLDKHVKRKHIASNLKLKMTTNKSTCKQISLHSQAPRDPPRAEVRTSTQSVVIAMPMNQLGAANNASLVRDPDAGTGSKMDDTSAAGNRTQTDPNSNSAD